MKKFSLFFLTVVVTIAACAQDTGKAGALSNTQPQNNDPAFDTVPPYKKNPGIPPFKIMQPDSTWFTNAELPKNKPVVIIYFSPECGHCQLAAQEISNSIDKLKDAFFVWVSYYSVPEIKTFTINYKLTQYGNFRFGRDPKYFLPTYYRVRFTPFMAVYDNNGQFVQAFDQGASPETLATLIHDNLKNKKKKTS